MNYRRILRAISQKPAKHWKAYQQMCRYHDEDMIVYGDLVMKPKQVTDYWNDPKAPRMMERFWIKNRFLGQCMGYIIMFFIAILSIMAVTIHWIINRPFMMKYVDKLVRWLELKGIMRV
jgi:hypothetical protein